MKFRETSVTDIEKLGDRIGTNGKLRRALGLAVIKNNNYFITSVAGGFMGIVAVLAILSGLDIKIESNVVAVVVAALSPLVTGMIRSWQEERSAILSYYYVVDKDGDGIVDGQEKKVTEQVKNEEKVKESLPA